MARVGELRELTGSRSADPLVFAHATGRAGAAIYRNCGNPLLIKSLRDQNRGSLWGLISREHTLDFLTAERRRSRQPTGPLPPRRSPRAAERRPRRSCARRCSNRVIARWQPCDGREATMSTSRNSSEIEEEAPGRRFRIGTIRSRECCQGQRRPVLTDKVSRLSLSVRELTPFC